MSSTPITDAALKKEEKTWVLGGPGLMEPKVSRKFEKALRKIEQAIIPDPYDEREISLDWLVKRIHNIIDGARR